MSRRRRRPTDLESFERSMERYSNDPERLAVIIEHGVERGFCDGEGEPIETADGGEPDSRWGGMNDHIRRGAPRSFVVESKPAHVKLNKEIRDAAGRE